MEKNWPAPCATAWWSGVPASRGQFDGCDSNFDEKDPSDIEIVVILILIDIEITSTIDID